MPPTTIPDATIAPARVPRQASPYTITYALIAANVLAFLAMVIILDAFTL